MQKFILNLLHNLNLRKDEPFVKQYSISFGMRIFRDDNRRKIKLMYAVLFDVATPDNFEIAFQSGG